MIICLSFRRIPEENNTTKDSRYSFSHYYVPYARIKDFNPLIDGKSFFDLLVKDKEKISGKIMNMSNNNNLKTGNLLDFVYFK